MSVNWLFFDLNSYFASCEQQNQPHLRGRPVGVVPMMGVETTVCLAASYEAKARGVKTGTLVGEAKKLCPGIVFVEASHDLYVKYHHEILEAVESCVPVSAVLSVDEMACELTGSQKNLDVAITLAKKIKTTVQSRVGECLTSSIGLAPNRFLAKVASDMQKPNGLTVLLKDELPGPLLRLKPRDFPGIGQNMEERLHRLGIRTVEQMWSLTEPQMREVWGGIVGSRFYRWLRGEEISLPPSQQRSIGHQHVLEPELRSRDGALMILQKLLAKAAVRMRKNRLFAKRLSVHVRFMNPGGSWDQAVRLEETRDTWVLMQAARDLWRALPEGRPLRVGAVLSDLVPDGHHQLSFFESPRRDSVIQTVDSINTRFGRDTVFFGGAYVPPTRISFSRVPDLDEF